MKKILLLVGLSVFCIIPMSSFSISTTTMAISFDSPKMKLASFKGKKNATIESIASGKEVVVWLKNEDVYFYIKRTHQSGNNYFIESWWESGMIYSLDILSMFGCNTIWTEYVLFPSRYHKAMVQSEDIVQVFTNMEKEYPFILKFN